MFLFQFILIFSWVDFTPASDGDYTFPTWGDGLGWLMTAICVIGMILPGVYYLCVTKGTLSEVIKTTILVTIVTQFVTRFDIGKLC